MTNPTIESLIAEIRAICEANGFPEMELPSDPSENLLRYLLGVLQESYSATTNTDSLAEVSESDESEIAVTNNPVKPVKAVKSISTEVIELSTESKDSLDLITRFELAGYIDKPTSQHIRGSDAVPVLLKFYEKYRDKLINPDRYGEEYILSIDWEIQKVDTNRLTKDGKPVKKKMQVPNEKDLVTGLQSEFKSGFKSSNRLDVLSGKVKDFSFVYGYWLDYLLVQEAIPFKVRFHNQMKVWLESGTHGTYEVKPDPRTGNPRAFYVPKKVDRTVDIEVLPPMWKESEALEGADYPVKGAKFRHKWGTKPVSAMKLSGGGGWHNGLMSQSRWMVDERKDGKAISWLVIRISQDGSEIWIDFTNKPSIRVAKVGTLANGQPTILPIQTLIRGTAYFDQFMKALEFLGLGEGKSDTPVKMLRRQLLAQPRPQVGGKWASRKKKARQNKLMKGVKVK